MTSTIASTAVIEILRARTMASSRVLVTADRSVGGIVCLSPDGFFFFTCRSARDDVHRYFPSAQ
jgi:hypothetical protein